MLKFYCFHLLMLMEINYVEAYMFERNIYKNYIKLISNILEKEDDAKPF